MKGTCSWCHAPDCDISDDAEKLCAMCYTSPSAKLRRETIAIPRVDGGGLRYNEGKLRYDLLPTDATAELVKVLTHGSKKYAPRNWERGQMWSIPYASCMRHLQAWYAGEDNDPESGISHLAHAACNVFFLLAYQLRGMTTLDDREHLHKRDVRAIQHSTEKKQ